MIMASNSEEQSTVDIQLVIQDEVKDDGDSVVNKLIKEHLTEKEKWTKEKINFEAKIAELQGKLWDQTEINAELRKTKEMLSEEIMELTNALFEEANGMVAQEAKARANLETIHKKLENELLTTREHLKLERQQLSELRRKLSSDSYEIINKSDDSSTSKVDSLSRSAPLSVSSEGYFSILLPKHRFVTRQKLCGHSGPCWSQIFDKFSESDLGEFSKFVEKASSSALKNDIESLLSLPFLRRICENEVSTCLRFDFQPKPFVRRLAISMLKNSCCIEEIIVPEKEVKLAQNEELEVERVEGGSKSAIVVGNGGDSPKKQQGSTSPINNNNHEKGTSQRLRGIMNQFTASVTSLPDSLIFSSTSTSNTEAPKFCALCGTPASPQYPLLYRLRLGEGEQWMYIDEWCRERLVSAGHFFTFIRHIRLGVYSHRPLIDLFCDLLHFRRCMFYSHLTNGATLFFMQSDLESYTNFINESVCKQTTVQTAAESEDDLVDIIRDFSTKAE